MTIHNLKIDVAPFNDLLTGTKTGEVRNDDRGFVVSDTVRLTCTDGRTTDRTISHIQRGYGLPEGICVLSYTRAVPDVPKLATLGAIDMATGELIRKSDMDENNILHIAVTGKEDAVAIIAAKGAEIVALNKLNALVVRQREEANTYGDEGHRRAAAAEGELITIANHLDCEADIDSILHSVREIEADKDIYKERAEAAEAKHKAERDDKDAIIHHAMKLEAELAQYKDQIPIGYITAKAQLSLLQEFSASDSISPVKMGECRVAIYDRPAPAADLKAKCDQYEQALDRISKMDRSHGSWETIAYDATNIAGAALNVEASNDKG